MSFVSFAEGPGSLEHTLGFKAASNVNWYSAICVRHVFMAVMNMHPDQFTIDDVEDLGEMIYIYLLPRPAPSVRFHNGIQTDAETMLPSHNRVALTVLDISEDKLQLLADEIGSCGFLSVECEYDPDEKTADIDVFFPNPYSKEKLYGLPEESL